MFIAFVSSFNVLAYLFLQTIVSISNVSCFRYVLRVLLKNSKFDGKSSSIYDTRVLIACFQQAVKTIPVTFPYIRFKQVVTWDVLTGIMNRHIKRFVVYNIGPD